jgi:hypothetical protein
MTHIIERRIFYCYAGCCYAECRYAECHGHQGTCPQLYNEPGVFVVPGFGIFRLLKEFPFVSLLTLNLKGLNKKTFFLLWACAIKLFYYCNVYYYVA